MVQRKFERESGFLGSELNEQRLAGEFCDVTLTIGERQFRAHRNVLAAGSPYFRAMFSNDLLESGKTTISMAESIPDEEALEMLMDLFYLGTITITDANAPSLLAAADLLLLSDLKTECSKVLKSALTFGNCLGVWLLADRHSCEGLCKAAFQFALNNFDSVAMLGEYFELSLEHVLKLLKSDQLAVESEEAVFKAAMSWIHHDEDNRKAHLMEMLTGVRLPLCSEEFLLALTIDEGGLIESSIECRRAIVGVILAKNQQQPPAKKKRNDVITMCQPRTPAVPRHQSLCIFFEPERSNATANTVEHAVLPLAVGRTFSVLFAAVRQRMGFVIASLADRIVVFGGYNGTNNLKTVKCYNTGSDQWTSLAPMSFDHVDHCAAVLDGKIYAISGRNTVFVERYDPANDSWASVAPLATARTDFAAVTLDDAIYVLGGRSKIGFRLQWVERFDLSSGTWTTITPMTSLRQNFGCAVFEGKIFVAGGLGGKGDDSLASVECFDPVTQQWTGKGSLIEARHRCSLAVVDGRLLAIGGRQLLTDRCLDTVEEYEPATDSWRFLCTLDALSGARFGHGVGVVPLLFGD